MEEYIVRLKIVITQFESLMTYMTFNYDFNSSEYKEYVDNLYKAYHLLPILESAIDVKGKHLNEVYELQDNFVKILNTLQQNSNYQR